MKNFCFRYFNAAGADVWANDLGPAPGDTPLIPRIFEAAMGERTHFDLYGTDYDTPDGTCVRDYIHVCDLALAHVKACKALSDGSESKTYNLGTSSVYSNKEIVTAFTTLVGCVDVLTKSRREGDPDTLIADSSLFTEEQGLAPSFSDLETIILSLKDYYEKKYQ